MKYQTLYITEPGKVELRERDVQLKPTDILAKTLLSSICGTDRNHFMGHTNRGSRTKEQVRKYGDEHSTSYPMVIGHEGCGIVEEVGSAVSICKKGDLISSFCVSGTMGEYFVCPGIEEGYGIALAPKGMSPIIASQGEPAACAIYAGLQSGVELGDTVAVVGAGFAGQVIAQVVKKMGAYKVIVADIVDKKLEIAKSLGADVTINPSKQDFVDLVLKETDNAGVDVAIEVGGVAETVQMCSDVIKHGGILGLYSWILDPVKLYVDRWHNDGFDIRTLALMHRIHHDRIWYIRQALSIMARGIVKIEPLLTHTIPLKESQRAFEIARDDVTACKVVIKP